MGSAKGKPDGQGVLHAHWTPLLAAGVHCGKPLNAVEGGSLEGGVRSPKDSGISDLPKFIDDVFQVDRSRYASGFHVPRKLHAILHVGDDGLFCALALGIGIQHVYALPKRGHVIRHQQRNRF